MLGNLAEWEEYAYLHHDTIDGDTLSGFVMGGSYLGINQIGNSTFAIYNSQPTPTSVLATSIQGKANSSSNAIGFRCMVYLR